MKKFAGLLATLLFSLLLASCSSTLLNESWKDPNFSGKIDSVYIVGVSKNNSTRRIFEDSFNKSFSSLGISGYSSYRDFPDDQAADKDAIMTQAKKAGATAIQVTRMLKKETETVVNPGRITSYYSGSYYPSHYGSYGAYYPRRYETVYEPPTVSQFEIATIESNIYDIATGDLIWGARLETTVDSNHQKLIDDFIKVVTRDLKEKGLI